ncbi:hypothetical protein BD289DRAFT_442319 [Coniella lustricola]|uniref:Uncharacterized protein n=1 Tax=Coniella lustricola TaxID=2025994 RepID=A0A2T2ZYC7_9PEZI|nr:hypothetical protein BD289DRAFT_442319 [Coniella lustricola]
MGMAQHWGGGSGSRLLAGPSSPPLFSGGASALGHLCPSAGLSGNGARVACLLACSLLLLLLLLMTKERGWAATLCGGQKGTRL